ncbi:stage II sporulation protein M [Anaerosphaera multitolerans]|uniref:Stage II sporulation protein M n=1 Tax=Anaerosphaera multitolerans TaxID=2487351 RepID=A0A437S6F8_9FIRM|nr:stage II sporulation protein M [Anaerosphaera multitolerans]RVU54589.1 stage II sporulation protein M [Anaerosphaera multitolerans]
MDLKYKKTLRKIIVFASIAFLISVVGSYFWAKSNSEVIGSILGKTINGIMNNLDTSSFKNFGVSLFLNNIRAVAVMTVMGFIPFLFIPIFSLILNGMIIGMLPVLIQRDFLRSMVFGILPHGIFEIPALVLGASLGTMLCITLIKKIFRRDAVEIKVLLKYILTTYLKKIIPLLIIAAVVEAYITPLILMKVNF